MPDHHRILSPLLLCLLAVTAPAAGSTQAFQGFQCRWPVGHLAAYDFTVPAQIAAIVPEDGTEKPGLFDVRTYEIQLSYSYAGQGVSVTSSTSLLAVALIRGQSVKGVTMIGTSCSASYSDTSGQSASASGMLLPESINADGTVNWKLEFHLNQGQSAGNPNLSFSTTGFLAPSNGHLAPVTVHLKPDGSQLKITYVRGKFITVTADVREPIRRVLGSVDLDDHRTVILVETRQGVRALLLDRSSGTVTLLSSVKIGRGDYAGSLTFRDSLAIAVPESDGVTLALLTPGGFNPLAPALVVRIKGNVSVLDVRPYLNYILAAAEVNGTVTLLAVNPLLPKLLPVKKESEDARRITFAVDLNGMTLKVTYDKSSQRIVSASTESTTVGNATTPQLTIERPNPANPQAHGGVKLDLNKDITLKNLSKLATVKVLTDSGTTTGTLYLLDTDWGRFYGAVVGSRLVLVPAEVHPIRRVKGEPTTLTVRVDVQPNPDGTVTVTVHDPVLGDLKVPGCAVRDRNVAPAAFPTQGLIQALRNRGLTVNTVTLGSFAPALITGQVRFDGSTVTSQCSIRLSSGTQVTVNGIPLLTLALKDGKLAVITQPPASASPCT